MLRCKNLLIPSMCNTFLVLCILLLGTQDAKATHALGSDLTYICVGPNQYALTLNVYRDCNGINLPGAQTVSWTGSCGSSSLSLQRTFEADITPICPGGQSACNNGSGAFGVEQHTYTGIVTFPPGCTNITLSWRLCCRNFAITTLTGPGGERMYVESTLDNSIVPCNNSPIFLNPPAAFTCLGNTVFYNHGAVDFDGDSLSFSLIPCLDNAGNPVNYAPGFSGTAPFGAGTPVNIDPGTGAITFTANALHVGVLCVLVTEFRNGVQIGSIMRDMQFRVLPCTNVNPVLSGVNGAGIDSIDFITSTCFGTQVCFDVVGTDVDAGDILSMFDNGAIQGSSFSVSGPGVPSGNSITGTFCWTPTAADLGTHTFTITIQDDACPLVGSNTFTYIINVIANPNDPVNAGPDQSICVGDTASLSATTISPNGVSYSWSPALGLSDPNIPNPDAFPPSTTTYTVTLLYNDGCESTDQVTITVEDDPSLAVSPNNINVCGGNFITLSATTDAPGMTFAWTDNTGCGGALPGSAMFPINDPGIVVGPTSQLTFQMCNDPGTYNFQCVVTNPFTGCTTTENITLTVGVIPPEPACRNIYASTTGSIAASGSQFDPVTLDEALRRSACNNAVIKLATGLYNIDTALNITSLLTLEGGFIQNQAWLKTSEVGATTINRTVNNPGGVLNSNMHLTALEVFGSSNFRLQDLRITTDDAVIPGTSTYGIFMNNASDYNITRVSVEPGNATNGSVGTDGCAGAVGTAGAPGQDGDATASNLDIRGGQGGFGGNMCTSGQLVQGGFGGRNSDLGFGTGNAGAATNANIGVVNGGGGGGGGRGGPGITNGGDGGASGRGGTPQNPPFSGCGATASGQTGNVTGGFGGTANTQTPPFNLGTVGAVGNPGINGISGNPACNGTAGGAGSHVACRYQVGTQGATGMSGSGGSGGGGGGGGGGKSCAACITQIGTGNGGGGGGGGGAGGVGGTGGFGGGASFGIYMCSNGANGFIEHCNIVSGSNGTGGAGGNGGVGGAGGTAGLGATVGTADPSGFVSAGGDGGLGGNGGDGGDGGVGASGIAMDIFWDGTGTIPAAQDSTYGLFNQQIIFVENTNCTNAPVMFWDSSTMHPLSVNAAQVIPMGGVNTPVTNWIFDAIGSNTVPPNGTFNADTTEYNAIGRFSILHNTCALCPPAGGAAGTALEEYRGFHNIAFDKSFKPEILSSANVLGVDTFQLCVGDFATFESSFFGDTSRWDFAGAIANPGNVQFVPNTQFNVSGFFMIQLFLITDCCGDTPIDTAYLFVDPTPATIGNGDQIICSGDSVNLAVLGFVEATDTVIWTPTSNLTALSTDSVSVYPTATTTYNASVYSKVVTGANNITRLACPVTISYTVTVNPLPDPVMSSTDVVCNNDGSATALPPVGTYNFVWSNGTTDNAVASSTINSLATGSYCVTVTDVVTGCVDTGCIFVAPAAIVPTVFANNITAVSCFGADDGSVVIGTVNGVAPYTYVWDTIVPGIVSPTSANYTVTGLAPRDYCVTSTDNSGCVSVICFNIPTPQPLTIAIIDTIHPVCQSGNDGRIEIEGQGGTGLYTYSWSTGLVTSDSGILSPIDTGFYCVTVTDENNCSATFCINLDAQQVITTAAVISSPILCNGGTACIAVNATGASGAYSYSWSGPGVTAFSTGNDTSCGFPAGGLYNVLVTDSTFGCTTTVSVSVTQPSLLTSTMSSQANVNCNGDLTGNAQIGASGGSTPYTFLWDASAAGQTTTSATGLGAGTYCVTVTDSLLCTSVSCVTITEPSTSINAAASITSNYNGAEISCFGIADGDATGVGSGGTPGSGYTFQWDGNATNQTTAIATGLSFANNPYMVTVTDSLGCADSATVVISQPTAVTATISSVVTVTCFGDSDGEATGNGAGGTGTYSFNWSFNTGPQLTPTATGLNNLSNPYCVTVTDINGCADSVCVNISQPTGPVVSSANVVQHVNCNGGADGIAAVISSGGTGTNTYLWSGGTATGATTDTITGLSAGVYCVTVSDANACTATHCVTITQPSTVVAAVTSFTNALCTGTATGTATASGTGGNAGTSYTFLWDNGQTNAIATGLIAGTYCVTVSDDSLCTNPVAACVTITEPTVLATTTSVTTNYNGSDITCIGALDGCVAVVTTGGLGGYTYLWSPAGAADSICGLGAGQYFVTVTDSVGCQAFDSITITAPAPVNVTINSTTNVACTADSTGEAIVSGTGGSVGPYTFAWDNGHNGATNSNLASGVHCVTVSDVNSCPAIACVTLTQPSNSVTGVIVIDSTVSCNGGSNAGVHIVASGGTPSTVNQTNGTGYNYTWTNSSTDTSSTLLAAGTHCVTITDSLNCSSVVCVTLTEPSAVTASIAGSVNISCFGDSTGTATATAIGGQGAPYDFVWDDPLAQPTATATGLAANTNYTVTVSDVNSCTATTSVSLSQPTSIVTAGIAITTSYNGEHVSCFGATDACVLVTGAGGTQFTSGAPYLYDWGTSTADSLCNIGAGTYTVTVTDSLGCQTVVSVTVQEPTLLTVGNTVNNNVSCFGDSTGSACVTPAGGTAPYFFVWPNGATTICNNNLPNGNHTVTVTDNNGCSATEVVTITQPLAATTIPVAVVDSNVSCNGFSDGGITISATGGTPGYTFVWTANAGPQTTPTITGLAVGTYCVTATDALGCSVDTCLTITEPTAVIASVSGSTNISCTGGTDGTATATGAGGTVVSGYQFIWNAAAGNQVTATATGLAANILYCVTVTDDNGCTATDCITLTQPLMAVSVLASVTSNFNGADVSCNGSTDGSVMAVASGGSGTPANFTYDWNAGTGITLSNLGAGMYIVTVTDSLNCTAVDTTIITEPTIVGALMDSTSLQPVSCFGDSTGSVAVNPSGGTAPYTFVWTNGQTNQTANNLPQGNACVTVSDANGCTASVCINIAQPATAVVVSGIAVDSNVSCNGFSDGGATATPAGGVPFAGGTYSFEWDDPLAQTGASATGLAAGAYCVTVTDSLGCLASSCVTITEPSILTATIASQTNVNCFGDSTGTATAGGLGGTPTYTFQWSANTGSQATATATGLEAGTLYQVTVTDDNGCQAFTNVTLSQPVAALTSGATVATDYNGADVTCVGASDACITATTAGGSGNPANFNYNWGPSGPNADTICGLNAGIYNVTVTDSLGCPSVSSVTVNNPPVLTATITSVSHINCFGDSTGAATVTPAGGTTTGAYTFLWNNGNGTATTGGNASGIATVTVTDANGCSVTASVNIMQPANALVISNMSVDSNASCNGFTDGGATVTAAGGTEATTGYLYTWSASVPGGQATASVTGLAVGTHSVTVTDSLGCTAIGTVIITEPTAVTATITATVNVNCFGDSSGTATVTGSGGTALSGYTFQWSANTGNQITQTATGLLAGVVYSVTVTDDNGCQSNTATIILTQPTQQLTVTGTEVTAVSCAGLSDGVGQASGLGGSGTISYLWDASTGNATTTTVSGLAAGTYGVTVTDSLLCTAITTVVITEPAALTVTAASVVNVICKGDSTGEITIGVVGGTPTYSFLWDAAGGNRTTQTIVGLAAGTYCVVVTDNNGCQDSICVILAEPVTAVDVTASVASNYNGSQIQCFGDSSGIAVAVTTGGTVAVDYQYAWSITTQTTDTAVGLPDGTFCVTVTDDLGCTDTACVTILEPTQVTASIAATTNVACLGDNTGSATAVGSGGTGIAYTFLWDLAAASQTTSTATGLSTGLYGVTVSDVNGCVGVATVSITEPNTAINANAIVTSNFNGQQVSCNNAFDGVATASAVGGTPGYTFQWNSAASGQTTAAATNLGAGITYCVTITDASGCQDSACVVLTEPAAVIPNVDTTINVLCFGDSTGAATVSATGGVGPYTFQWEVAADSQTTPTATGLIAGSYTVTVVDANGCIGAAVVIVGQPAGALDVDAVVTSIFGGGTPIQCFGDSTGTALATITGGTPPYAQLWDHGPTTLAITNLTDGTYCITATDSFGCQDTACVILTEPTQVALSLVSTSSTSCNGGCDGTATVTANGGVPGYTYLWDAAAANQTTPMATGLCAGVYGVSATDANGCTSGFNVTISEPATAVVANATVVSNYNGTQVSCNGASDGIIVATAVGGTVAGNYNYIWTTGVVGDTLDGTQTGVSVPAGVYCVSVSDDNGCVDVACITVTEPTQVTATIAITTNVNCNGDSTGSATATAAGGTAPYSFLWEAAAGSQGTATATGLTAGSYIVTITDNNNCSSQAIAVISEPNSAIVAGATITQNILCFGDSSGAGQVTILGGSAPYSILWDHGPTTQAITGLPDGTYCATVTDSLGCMDTTCIVFVDPTPVAGIVSSDSADCRGTATGSATVTPSNGTPGYTYSWDAAAGNQVTQTATGLAAGPYCVTITDANGCTTSACGVVGEPATNVNVGLIATSNYNGSEISCNGASDGSVSVAVTGGLTPYTYLWTNGTNQDTLTGVAAGQHCVTVTDVNGCTDIACITLSEPSVVTATIATQTNVTCFGDSTGSAMAAGAGGTATAGYSFLWDLAAGSQVTPTAINLTAGSYNVTVTDNNGCAAVAIVIITQPATGLAVALNVTSNFNGQQISCAGAADGEVTATATGGTGAGTYSFVWNNPSLTNIATGLSVSGNPHCVTVIDNGGTGCTATACITLVEPSAVTATIASQTNVSCNGGTNGTATVTPTGGTGAFTYLWDAAAGGQLTQTATGLTVGAYCVTTTDANGCQATACVNITEPTVLTSAAAIASNYNGADVSCNGSCDGIVFATPTGGTAGYNYTWSTAGAGNTDTMYVACVGPVNVTITDNNGCTTTASVTLTEPSAVTATAVVDNQATCNGQCDGQATATGAGGTLPSGAYTFLWSATANGQVTATATGLCAGSHTVTVTDDNGCSNVTSVTITQPLLGVSASATITSNYNGQQISCNGVCDGEATATGAGGTVTTGYTFQWDAGASNQATAIATGLCAGTYTVTVFDNGGCSNTAVVTVTEPPSITATIVSSVSVSCGGGNDGQATVAASGGTPIINGFTYQWDVVNGGGQTTATATGLPGGVTIFVTVTDDNGCTDVDSVNLSQPANPLFVNPLVTSNYNGSDISCTGVCDGAVEVQIAGGIPGYNITWANGATVDSLSGLCAGTYVVTVSDNGGCTIVDSVTLVDPAPLVATVISITNVSCTGNSDGCIDVLASGGTNGYTYSIGSGPGQVNNGVFCNLSAGIYSVTVTDLNFCTVVVTDTVTEPLTLPTVTLAVTSNYNGQQVSCFGACDGEITATPVGGTASYSFSWSGTTQTTQTVTGMCAGVYSVLMTDNNGCTSSASVTITNPSQLQASLTGTTDALCFGDETGTASFTLTGGTAPYTYNTGLDSVVTLNTSATVTGLTAGGYNATITDANGCNVNVAFTITSPPLLTNTTTVTSSYANGTMISCSGACDGAATSVGAGGNPGSTYQFLWSNGATDFTASGLCAGTFTVTITDQNNCTAIDTVVLIEPNQLAATSTQVNINCFGDSTGQIQMTAVATTGTPNYTYQLGAQTNFSGLFTGLTAGTYCITVTDANNCSIVECVTLTQNTQLTTVPLVTSNFNGANISCHNSSDGIATVNVTGGQGGYNFQWSTGNPSTDQIVSGLAAGTYTITVTDGLGCIAIDSVMVLPPDTLNLIVTDTTHVLCFGQPTGAFTVAAVGGVGPYQYSFDGGITFTNQTNYTNLPANGVGVGYCVIVRDANGCIGQVCININEPAQLQGLADSLIMVSCFGGADGIIAVHGVGGIAPYSYIFDGGSPDTTRIFTGLAAGNYTVVVIDANGCTHAMTNLIITQPPALILTVDTTRNPTCTGLCDGVIQLSGAGGTPGYEFSIDGSTFQLSGIFSGLCDGSYTVYIRDAQGCVTSTQVTLTQPTPVIANPAVTSFYPASPALIQFNVSCTGVCDGSATATPTGGTPSLTGTYNYQWSFGGFSTQTVSGLCANTTYTVTVTDENGCTSIDSVILSEPTPVAAVFTQVENESCAGNDDGLIAVTAIAGSGTGMYTYNIGSPVGAINNGLFTGLAGSVGGTNYSVTVTDQNGCTTILDTLIFEPLPVDITGASVTSNFNGFDVSCFGAADGSATITHSGGTNPLSYLWDVNTGSQTTINATGLRAGTYCVTVTDVNGCDADTCITITQPTPLTMTAVSDSAGCNGGNSGTLSAIPLGGTGSYTYAIDSTGTISPFGTDSIWTGLSQGTYIVYVDDINGCGPVQQIVTVGQDAPIVATTTVISNYNGQQISCNGASDGIASVNATGGTVGGLFFTYQWSAGTPSNTQTVSGLAAGVYFVTVTDTVSNCTEIVSVTVVEPSAIVLTVDTTIDVSCNGFATGAVQVSATGGTPVYTYDIDAAGQIANTTGIWTGLTSGNYNVTTTDVNGCTATAAFAILEADTLTIDLDTVNVSCFGLTDGMVTAQIVGGTPFSTGFGYTVTWSPNQPGALDTIGNLGAGTYVMTVQDASGCVATATATVLEPSPIVVQADSVQFATCSDSNGLIRLIVTGGPSATNGTPNAYEFSIDGGSTFTSGSNPLTFSGLPSGFYDIVVRDTGFRHCIGVLAVDLGSNSDITATTSTTDETCFRYADGTATVNASSSAGQFTYQWYADPPGSAFPLPNGTGQTVTGLTGNLFDFDLNGTIDTNFTYYVIVTDANGCTGTFPAYLNRPDSMSVTASVIQDISCYNGNDGSAVATVFGRDAATVSYLWTTNGATDSLITGLSSINEDSTAYIIVITDAAGCTARDTAYVRQPELPVTASYTGSTINCADSTNGIVTLNSITGGTPVYLYSFAGTGPFGSEAILSQGLGAGVYTIYTQDLNGCIDSTENVIIRDTIDYVVTAYQDQTILIGETVDLYATINNTGIDTNLVTWCMIDPNTGIQIPLPAFDSTLGIITPDTFFTTTQFVVKLNNGCSDSSIVEIQVNPEQTVFVPNAFSPNGDGVNDVFTIYGSGDVRSIKSFMVFDRWGELVHFGENFEPNTTDPTNAWDGTFNGKPMNPAVFVYYAEVELINGETVIRKGDVTLVK